MKFSKKKYHEFVYNPTVVCLFKMSIKLAQFRKGEGRRKYASQRAFQMVENWRINPDQNKLWNINTRTVGSIFLHHGEKIFSIFLSYIPLIKFTDHVLCVGLIWYTAYTVTFSSTRIKVKTKKYHLHIFRIFSILIMQRVILRGRTCYLRTQYTLELSGL